jgi:hypothetical protein
VSGAKILWTGTLCPIAGTAFNLTAMSYDDTFDMDIHVDPRGGRRQRGPRSASRLTWSRRVLRRWW